MYVLRDDVNWREWESINKQRSMRKGRVKWRYPDVCGELQSIQCEQKE